MKTRFGIGIVFGLVVVLGAMYLRTQSAQQNNPPEPQTLAPRTIDGNKQATAQVISSTPTPSPVTAAPTITAEDHAKLAVLSDILEKKNDNDLRLDQDLKILSPGTKELFKRRYHDYAAEKLNERGTVVFLLGRNLNTIEDFEFLGNVLSEAPCLSMADCNKDSARASAHLESNTELDLAYPQIVALKSLERYLFSEHPTAAFLERALSQLRIAQNSKVHKVSELATEMLTRYERQRKSTQ